MSDGLTGSVIGDRYEIGALLGRGGMAAVYRAHDRSLGRDVAIKIFANAGLGENDLKRETAEIRLLASLNHHGLVTLFDAAVDDYNGAYFVMELVEGSSLSERITAGPIAQTDVALMLVDVADALQVVHGAGVVHRDIKPGNILLSPSASPSIGFRAKLADFGIAYLADSTRLTTPGTIVGTAAYVSPEQATGVAPGPASDIYSLGLVALESLTATRAFPGSLMESLAARLASDPFVPGELGSGWKSLLARMTSRVPADRPTAIEVAEAARDIDRALYGSQQPEAVTEALAATEAFASTAVLPSGGPDAPGVTAPLAATRVLPAADAPTERMAAPGEPVTTGARRTLPRRFYLALAGVVLVALALVIGLAVAPDPVVAPTPSATPSVNPTTPTPTPTTDPAPVVDQPATPADPGNGTPGNSNSGDKPGKPDKPGNGNNKK